MTVITVTKERGGKTTPIGMTVAEPACRMTESELTGFGGEPGLMGVFLAELMSGFAAQERCGVHLYRVAAGLTQIPEWRERYEEFGEETEEHVRIYEELIARLGGDPMYVSPQARMTQYVSTKLMEPILLEGSVDTLTQELTMLEAVMLAERKCHANWELVAELGRVMEDGPEREAIREAVGRVGPQEDEHVEWAETSWREMALAQLTPPGKP
jgi:rubrerythrin